LKLRRYKQARALESALEGAGGYPRFCWQGLDDEAGAVFRTIKLSIDVESPPSSLLLPPPSLLRERLYDH
jgi:hypothetical protein